MCRRHTYDIPTLNTPRRRRVIRRCRCRLPVSLRGEENRPQTSVRKSSMDLLTSDRCHFSASNIEIVDAVKADGLNESALPGNSATHKVINRDCLSIPCVAGFQPAADRCLMRGAVAAGDRSVVENCLGGSDPVERWCQLRIA